MFDCAKTLLALVLLIAAPVATFAQAIDQSTPSGQTSAQPAAQVQVRPAAQPDQSLLKPEQLEALVAPIALYPDELLANVLAASTYPVEVVQADRWLRE